MFFGTREQANQFLYFMGAVFFVLGALISFSSAQHRRRDRMTVWQGAGVALFGGVVAVLLFVSYWFLATGGT
jgi:predicted membrane channel-forming protein YqfA (hemolysin III family)